MSFQTLARRVPLAALLLPTLGGSAAALHVQQDCHTVHTSFQPTDWNVSLAVPRFDPALGLLKEVRLDLFGYARGSVRYESLDGQPSTVATSFQNTVSLARPDLSLLLAAVPTQLLSDDVTAFDGLVDYAGGSGRSHLNLMAADSKILFTSPASDLALFTGPLGAPGTISLPLTAVSTSHLGGATQLEIQVASEAKVTLRVCYFFALDCNGNGIPDEQDIVNGTSGDHDGNGTPDECQPSTVPFCIPEGPQGNGIECPCGNDAPIGSLEGCDNGSGTGGSLAASGVPSIAADTLVLSATQIPLASPGFFYSGTEAQNIGLGTPFDSGLRCLGGTTVRVRKLPLGAGGGSIPFPNGPSISMLTGAQAGDVAYFQFWYRNPNGPCGGHANTTNGQKVVWGL